jgi:anti-sigma B factor antagonist
MTAWMDDRRLPGLNGAGAPPLLCLLESRVGRRVVLAAKGEIDIASVDGLRNALEGAASSGAAEVWLDLTHVEFMDSTGLTALVEAHRRLSARGFAVICPDGPVRRVMAVTGVDRVIPVHPSRSAAHAGS